MRLGPGLGLGSELGVERAQVSTAVRPCEGRGLTEHEVPPLIVLQLEGVHLRLCHSPSEEHREQAWVRVRVRVRARVRVRVRRLGLGLG